MASKNVKNKKILLAEDDPFISEIYITYFKKAGFKIFHVKDGKECLLKLENEKFDLLMLDLLLPKIDGFEVLKKIKNKGKNIPVIVTSNISGKENIKKAMSLGASDYLIKTKFKPKEIIEKAQKFL